MNIPEVKPRRPHHCLENQLENDLGFIENNYESIMWFLANRNKLVEILLLAHKTIKGLESQQAMDDDWYEPNLEAIESFTGIRDA